MAKGKKRLALPSDENGHIRIFGMSLLLLLIPLALYFFVHIPNREDYFTQQYLRLLGDMSQQVTDKVNNYELILENASLNVTDSWNSDLLNTFSRRLRKDTSEIKTLIHESALDELLSPIIASSDGAQFENDPLFQELLPTWLETGVEKSFNLIPDLELVTSFIKFEERTVIEDAYSGKFADFEPNEDELQLPQHNNLNIEMLREQDEYWIHFYSEVYRRDYKYTVYIHAKSLLDVSCSPS